jgi:hypothetical protein
MAQAPGLPHWGSQKRAGPGIMAWWHRRSRRTQPAMSRRALAVVAAGVAVVLVLVATGLLLWNNNDANPNLQAQRRAAVAASKTVGDCVRRTEGANAAMNPGGDPSKQNYFDHGTGGAVTLTAEDYCQQVIAIENAHPCAPHTGYEVSYGRVACGQPAPTMTKAPPRSTP